MTGSTRVIPKGMEALVARMLDGATTRRHGWLLRGARLLPDRILAGYLQPSTGAVVTFLLVHPDDAPASAPLTRQFGVVLRSTNGRADADRLARWVLQGIAGEEAAFQWSVIEGGQHDTSEAIRSGECLTTCRPLVRDLIEAIEAGAAVAAEPAAARLISAASRFEGAPTAVMLTVHALGALGRHAEKLAEIDRALPTVSAPAREELSRQQLSMAADLGFRDEALAAARALLDAPSSSTGALLDVAAYHSRRHDHERATEILRGVALRGALDHVFAAEIYAAAERVPEARASVEHALHLTEEPDLVARAAAALGRAGDFDAEERIWTELARLDTAPLPALTRLAQLALWRGRYEDADRHASRAVERAPSDASALRYRGGASLFLGDLPAALASLEASQAIEPNNVETITLHAETLWRAGRPDRAMALLDRTRSLGGGFGPPELVAAAIRADQGEYGASYSPFMTNFVDRLPVSPAVLDRLGLTTAPHEETPAATLHRWLDALRGNRSAVLTTCVPGRGLVRIRPEDDARIDARLCQELLQTCSIEHALARFDDVLRRHSDKPYPLCHRGELLVWVGRYEQARRDFVAALEMRENTRWAYVGLGAVELLTGDPRRAIETLERGIVMAKGAGPTTFAYRGEAYLAIGEQDRAIADLDHAVREAPLRVGAWINLALARGLAGDGGEQTRIYQHLQEIAGGLLSEACRETRVDRAITPDPEEQRRVLEHARHMMRGNRSSTLGTWFDSGARLRSAIWGKRDPRREHLRWLHSAASAG